MKLTHFKPEEFTDADGVAWFNLMSVKLLGCLDHLRERTGFSISINKVSGAIGRTDTSTSQHNARANDWDEVRAVDVTVRNAEGKPLKILEAEWFATEAEACGFTGIGMYPRWNKPGFHLDVRWSKTAGGAAKWSDLGIGSDHVYTTGWDEGVAVWPRQSVQIH